MRAVLLLPTLPAYRKEFLKNLNSCLGEKNIELTVIHGIGFFKKAIKTDANPSYSAVPMDTVEYNLFGYRIVWWKGIVQKIRNLKPAVVIILFSPGNLTFWLVQLYCYISKTRVGIWSSGFTRSEMVGVKKKVRGVFLNFFLKRANFHICYGSKYKNELVALGIADSIISIAQNTIDIEAILSLDANGTRKLSTRVLRVLFVGALIREKNLGLAIEAVARLVNEGYAVEFDIVGHGPIIDELRALVVLKGMESNIFVLGQKYGPELSAQFSAADVFLLPGTGGLAVNEAMAYGLPVLSTVGDGTVLDLLVEGGNGYYLDDIASVDNIYSTLRRILHSNRSQLIAMGAESRRIVLEKATLKNMVSEFEFAILRSLR